MKFVKTKHETAQLEQVSPVERGGSSRIGWTHGIVQSLGTWQGRIWSSLLVVLLVVLLVPYFRVALALSRRVLHPFVGIPISALPVIGVSFLVLFSLLRPVWALAGFFAVAPLANGLVARLVLGSATVHYKAGMFWVEPLFLSLAIGLLFRRAALSEPLDSKRPETAVGFYAVVVLISLVLFFFQSPWWWDRLRLAWLHIPRMRQLSPNHPVRAGLLILGSLLCYRLTFDRLVTSKEIQLVCRGWLFGGLLTALYGLRIWARYERGTYPQVESMLDDANSYGAYLVLTLFVAWGEYLAEKELWARAMAGLTLILTVWMIPLSGSRIAIIAATVGAGMTWMILARPGRERWIKGCVLAAIASAILLFPFVVGSRAVIKEASQKHPRLFSAGLYRVAQAMDAGLVLKAWWELRQAMSAAGLRMVVDKPAFGQGPGTFYAKLGQYYRPGDEGWMPPYENAHNYFVQVAAETGVLGLAGFLWSVCAVMLPGFKGAPIEERRRVRLLIIGTGGYLFTALAQHPLVLSEQAFLFWGYLGILGACSRLNEASPTASGLVS
jgi:hypothetical protein